jgi:hypothetical protein
MYPRGVKFDACALRTRRGIGNATLFGRISYSQRVLMKRDLYTEVSPIRMTRPFP